MISIKACYIMFSIHLLFITNYSYAIEKSYWKHDFSYTPPPPSEWKQDEKKTNDDKITDNGKSQKHFDIILPEGKPSPPITICDSKYCIGTGKSPFHHNYDSFYGRFSHRPINRIRNLLFAEEAKIDRDSDYVFKERALLHDKRKHITN